MYLLLSYSILLSGLRPLAPFHKKEQILALLVQLINFSRNSIPFAVDKYYSAT